MRLLCAGLLLAATVSTALAQRAPEIVVPGRPGVPVYINGMDASLGIDASWGIVEGEFGLDRPNENAPTVIWRPYFNPLPNPVRGYYPSGGKPPGYGRLEILPPPNRRLPPPAPTYYRNWSSESAPSPVTEYSPYPPMTVVPAVGRGGRHSDTNRRGEGHTRH